MERDVCGNHVIPVKLAGELSQPLDPLSMRCDGSLSLLSAVLAESNCIYLCDERKNRLSYFVSNTTSRSFSEAAFYRRNKFLSWS